jgi:D-aminoacyl-tRNA deacylase
MLVIGLVYSLGDPAGLGIAEYIRETCSVDEVDVLRAKEAWKVKGLEAVLAGFEEDVIYFDFLDEVLPDAQYYVFLSRHSSSAHIKSLTTHHTGNPWGRADAGGKPYELSISNPPLAWFFLRGLFSRAIASGLRDFQVTYEATHHGPTNLSKPLTFIEIGSSPEEWRLRKAHELVGDVVIETLKKGLQNATCVPTAGFGGQHYAEKFTRRALDLGECYGHIIPRYALKELKSDTQNLGKVIRSALTKSSVKIDRAVVLKKAGGVVRKAVEEAASELSIEVLRD